MRAKLGTRSARLETLRYWRRTVLGLAVTGALTVGAVVVGVLALSAHADYDTYESGGDRVDAENVRVTGEALNIVTDVLIGTAAAAAS